jgi:hypothetical protein
MSRSYTSSPPCASMACSGTPLPFFILIYRGRVSTLGTCDIFMKEVQPLRDKHDKLRIVERALFFSGELTIPTIRVAVRR